MQTNLNEINGLSLLRIMYIMRHTDINVINRLEGDRGGQGVEDRCSPVNGGGGKRGAREASTYSPLMIPQKVLLSLIFFMALGC